MARKDLLVMRLQSATVLEAFRCRAAYRKLRRLKEFAHGVEVAHSGQRHCGGAYLGRLRDGLKWSRAVCRAPRKQVK
jgi:hypothetical protein